MLQPASRRFIFPQKLTNELLLFFKGLCLCKCLTVYLLIFIVSFLIKRKPFLVFIFVFCFTAQNFRWFLLTFQ